MKEFVMRRVDLALNAHKPLGPDKNLRIVVRPPEALTHAERHEHTSGARLGPKSLDDRTIERLGVANDIVAAVVARGGELGKADQRTSGRYSLVDQNNMPIDIVGNS